MIDTAARRIESKHRKVKGGMESPKASLDIYVGEVEKNSIPGAAVCEDVRRGVHKGRSLQEKE